MIVTRRAYRGFGTAPRINPGQIAPDGKARLPAWFTPAVVAIGVGSVIGGSIVFARQFARL